MDTVLLSVAVLSLAVATGLAIVVASLVRNDRRRSDARTEALAEMAAEPADRFSLLDTPADPPAAGAIIRPVPVTGVSELFATPAPTSAQGRRFAIAGGLAVVIGAIGFALVSTGRPAAPPIVTPQASSASVPAPLELLSLRHTVQDSGLTITGLVQNPRGSVPMSRVVATALLFGPDGAFLSSVRAPLDFTTIGAGDESPFVLTAPVAGQIARYRVSFRNEHGAVISHIDRREPDALASK